MNASKRKALHAGRRWHLGEVPIPRVDGLELAAVDPAFAEQFKTATHLNPSSYLDRAA